MHVVWPQRPSLAPRRDASRRDVHEARTLRRAELTHDLTKEDCALIALGSSLLRSGYRFTTPTPATHGRVNARPVLGPVSLTDIFGWSRPFADADLPDDLLVLLMEARAVMPAQSRLRSTVRFSTLGQQIFLHSAYPTEQDDAVFFGPDTYRFARMLERELPDLWGRKGLRILDIGAGSGAGGLHASTLLGRESRPAIVLGDINEQALRSCRINAAINGVANVEVLASDLYAGIGGRFDVIMANPPYLVDGRTRLYRHGGGTLGAAISLAIVDQGIARLRPRGRLLLYTGSAIVDGKDLFLESLEQSLAGKRVRLRYDEIDPDVFGEELEHPPYDQADRIAAVSAVIESLETS
jgi:methylase of polypeptide subunit release factors